MKIESVFLCVLLAANAIGAYCHTAAPSEAASDSAAIAGVWRAQVDGLPFITLTVTNEGGKTRR